MSDQLIIFDTTLRDGEQSPGASMNLNDKVRIARALEKLRVDVIEAGFPIASQGDFESVRAVATTIKDSRVCGLARAVEEDIERAAEAVRLANASRIHTFLATSPIHIQNKLRITPDEVIEQIKFAVTLARNYTDDVEFSPEDASRSEPDFLCRAVEVAISAGATTINIPDTVGYAWPEQYAQSIANLIERVPNSDKAVFSVHCHDDLGLAVSNSLQAVLKGARQIECTINGLGERAGNASLEEIVMAVRVRQDIFPVDTRINSREIMAASRLVSSITGFPVQPNKAVVGANAFAHESGIHQDGVIKKRETYEIMRAQDIGWDTNKIVLGKHSGRNAFKTRLAELGFEFSSEEELKSAFMRFKELADKKHEVFDDDLQVLVSEEIAGHHQDKYRLVSLEANSTMDKHSSAKVELLDGENSLSGLAKGDGPVDAAFKAIKAMLNVKATLLLYSVNNITSGTDSQGEVTVRLKDASRIVNGQGADTDIVVASAKAYIAALNKLVNTEMRFHPQNESLV